MSSLPTPSFLARSYSHLSFTVIITMLVWWIRYVAEVNTVVGCPSCKNQNYLMQIQPH